MTCGWLPQANNPANRKCPIAAGASIGLQFHHQSAAATDDIVDPTHEGPIIVYLAKSETGAGNVWFKIYEDGYTNGKWAVDRLIANKGRVDVTLPSDIAPGNYLLRAELIALHGAYALNGVQPYVGCVELTISGSGKANPSGVAFPGYYSNTDPGMLFDLYGSFTSYPIPGPAKYVSGSAPSSSGSASSSSGSASTPAPTSKPPSSPTSAPNTPAPNTPAPSNPTGSIRVGLNGGSNEYWIGVTVSGGGETTVKVEITDSGSVRSWVALVDKSYAYVYDKSPSLRAPISVRLTSSTGKQVTLTNVFTSFVASNIDTGKTYTSSSSSSSSSGTATNPPTPTNAPTTKPPSNPTSPPATGNKVSMVSHPSSSSWWFAVTVSGNSAAISQVEIMDSGNARTYRAMIANSWGYSYSAQGSELVAPITVRVTANGKSVTATFSSIRPNLAVEASGSL